MAPSAFFLLTAATASAFGIALQRTGGWLFARWGRGDTRDYAAVLGLRLGAVFSIVVGLIHNSTYGDYAETRRALLEEAGLLQTLHGLAAAFPETRAADTRGDIVAYARRVAGELDPARQDDASLAAASAELYALCERSPSDQGGNWTPGEFQRVCSALAELRGRRLARVLEEPGERGPLAAFLCLSFAALAVLLGVFERTRAHLLLGGLLYAVTGLTFALIHGLSEPFAGPLALDGTPLLQLAATLTTR